MRCRTTSRRICEAAAGARSEVSYRSEGRDDDRVQRDEALLADYVRRHAIQPERPVEIDAGRRVRLHLSRNHF